MVIENTIKLDESVQNWTLESKNQTLVLKSNPSV